MAVKTGTSGADRLLGTAADDTLNGLAGNDILQGLAGIDRLNGGLGDDDLRGDAGNDQFTGGSGKDTYNGGVGFDGVAFLSEGGPRGVVVNLATGQGTDTFGHADRFLSIEDIIGSNVKDTLTGNSLSNILYGFNGDDLLNGAAGNDRLIGEDGKDKLVGGAGNDNLDGGADKDNLNGGDDNDTLLGGAGDDILEGQKGVDILNGGAGLDAAEFGGETGTLAVIVNLRLGTARDSYGNTDKLIGIEGVFGSNGVDILTGHTGVNSLYGFAGSDQLAGGAGADFLNGGTGTDTVDYSLEVGAKGVTVNLATQRAVDTYGNTDVLTSIESATGTVRNDKLIGNTSVNTLAGGGGNDEIIAGGNKDTLRGEAGNDILTTSIGPSVRPTTVTGTHSVTGGDGNDTINLNDASIPVVQGGAGLDTLVTSVDAIRFGNDIEKVVGVGTKPIKIELLRDDPGDVTGNSANNSIVGGSGADTLRGGGGNDTIQGHNGSDNLQGDTGNDTLTGGLIFGMEVDRFHATIAMGQDTITDFAIGVDKLVGASGASIQMSGPNESIVTCVQGSFKLTGVAWFTGDFDGDTASDDIRLFDGNGNTADMTFFNTNTPDISVFLL